MTKPTFEPFLAPSDAAAPPVQPAPSAATEATAQLVATAAHLRVGVDRHPASFRTVLAEHTQRGATR